METSVKRAEKLVHATNSALAQMKFSLMFEDGLAGGEKSFRKAVFSSDGDDLKQCQDLFRVEANEMLSKMDKMLGSADVTRKNRKALDRIKEINRKMNALKQDHPKLRGSEQSSEKPVSLLAEEKLSPPKPSSKVRTKQPSPCKRDTGPPEKPHNTPKKPHPPSFTQSPVKSKEELKSSILETRQIVDRGFHTARHLAQKVENMTRNDRKEKTGSLEKAVSETNLRSLDGTSESNETTKSCRHAGRSGGRDKNGEPAGGVQPRNARVVDVKRREGRTRRNLRVQRLPSVDIRGGLQLQKVHSLEIPGWGAAGAGKANTGIHIISHERIERAKMDEVLSEARREGQCCDSSPGKCVECTNCGKVMRVQHTRVDARRVDEILRKCRFNVFDPRIDEFVEKYAATDAWKAWESAGKAEVEPDDDDKTETKKPEVAPRAVRGFSLEDLSKKLSTRYRQEAEELEGHHLRLNSLLKSLFRKIDESREVFEECHLLKNGKTDCGRVLTRTEPVVVSLMGSPVAARRQKLDKRDVKNRNKSRTRSSEDARGRRKSERKHPGKENEEKVMLWRDEGGADERSCSSREATEGEQKAQSPASTDRSWGFSQPVPSIRLRTGRTKRSEAKAASTQSSGSSSPEKQGWQPSPEGGLKRDETDAGVKASSEVSSEKSDNNYESDFESLTNEYDEPEVVPGDKKLSTISEVDSELEKKLSDEQKTQLGSLSSGLPDEPKPSDADTLHGRGKPIPDASPETSRTENIPSLKSTPTELVTSLKEILSALKDQFARTETLAEKLTENVAVQDKSEAMSRSPSEDGVPTPWRFPAETMVENLRSARKEPPAAAAAAAAKPASDRSHYEGMSADSLSDDGGSSLGEIVEGGQRKSSWQSSGQKEAMKSASGSKLNEEVSYSEGEIPSNLMADSECCSSRSVGEVRR